MDGTVGLINWTNGGMDERVGGLGNGWMKRRVVGWKNVPTNGLVDGRIDR